MFYLTFTFREEPMGREFKFFIVSSLFVLGAVFAVYTASSEAKGKPKMILSLRPA